MIFLNDGSSIYGESDALDMLENMGMNTLDIAEFKTILCGSQIEEAERRERVSREEFEAYEASNDSLISCLNEVMNIVDEALDMERISKARERFEAIRQTVNQYI